MIFSEVKSEVEENNANAARQLSDVVKASKEMDKVVQKVTAGMAEVQQDQDH